MDVPPRRARSAKTKASLGERQTARRPASPKFKRSFWVGVAKQLGMEGSDCCRETVLSCRRGYMSDPTDCNGFQNTAVEGPASQGGDNEQGPPNPKRKKRT